jgi:hypothetical protein
MINYGLDTSYGVVRDPSLENTDHQMTLDNLLPNTTYYFRVVSTDENKNQNISNDYIFTTARVGEEQEPEEQNTKQPGAGEEQAQGQGKSEGDSGQAGTGQGEGTANNEGSGKSPGEKDQEGQGEGQTLQTVVENIEQINDIQSLQTIVEKVQQQAQTITTSESPFIIESAPEIVEIGSDFVTIRWRTSLEANSVVAMATENSYNEGAADPYSWKEGEPDVFSKTHEITVNGLQPATPYHFQVQSRSRVNTMAKSLDKIFTTKSIHPEIYNINIDKLEEEAATIVWYTNVPCSSVIEYTNLENSEVRSEGSPNFTTRHSIRLTNLKFDTTYAAIIRVENEYGDKNSSAPITFTTIKDLLPPVISKVGTESTIYPGADAKIQTIINWDTDEMALCQFFYHQGLVSKGEQNSLPLEMNYTTKHIQVAIVFQQATVYKFWVICKDKTGNEAKSEDFTLLTPVKEQSIIDIIIANFQSTFGWMKKFGGN